MSLLTAIGAGAVTVMLVAYALEHRATAWVLVCALACAASSLYGWLAGTWPFGVVEGVWALVALRRWLSRRRDRAPLETQPALPRSRMPPVAPRSTRHRR